MPAYRLEYHAAAEQDLINIHRWIEDYAGGTAADRKLEEIEKATYGLGDFPKIGSVRDDLLPGLRAIPASEKAVICFTVDDETQTVFILCVGYAGSDWTSRIGERI